MDELFEHAGTTPYWYSRPGLIEHWFYGVFEGGGAKGVAYSGALLAMAEKRCWFKGVAGASAGAITAALIASGLSPDEIEGATERALQNIRTSVSAGLRRLQQKTGYFPSEKLHDWIDDHLKAQVARKLEAVPTGSVTFRDLYLATGIELNVVAADLSLKRQMVFSHHETPNCAVADAVVASCSIPFAFASQVLSVEDGESRDRVLHHTIVDGGVWANFPMHVFEDTAFRKYYERTPARIDSHEVLGFLLDEGGENTPPKGDNVRFVEASSASGFHAREWYGDGDAVDDAPTMGSRLGAWLLYPFYLLGRLVDWNSGVERGRWPTPRSTLANHVVHGVNGLLGGIYPLLFGLLACAVVAVGAWVVGSSVAMDQLRVIPETDWTDPTEIAFRVASILLSVLIISVVILVVFTAMLGVACNRIFLRAARRILYGLITTYVAGSGAPEWAAEKGNVVALPIPPTVNALSFDMPPEVRRSLIDSAREATRSKLSDLMPASDVRPDRVRAVDS